MMRFLANLKMGLVESGPPPLFIQYARLEDIALRTGLVEDFTRASEVFGGVCERAADELQPSDRYLLLLWTQVHERLQQLSAARILKEIQFPHQGFVAALLETASSLFYPPQAQILLERSILQPKTNLLVSLPTSTGKSLIGEMALVASLQWQPKERWLAVYLAPYRALADQLQDRMRRRLRRIDVACIKRRGNYLTDMSPIRQRRPTVLVATPEAFDALLRQHPDLYSCLSACVFDEFHLVEQHQRGLRYEGLVGRFLHGAAGDGWPKIVALSAVVTDTEEIENWLELEDSGFFHSAWKPTARRIAITSPDGETGYFTLGEEVPETRGAEPRWHGRIALPYRIETAPSRPRYDWGYGRYRLEVALQEQQILENVVAVVLDQHRRFREPILVLASSRAATRLIASRIGSEFRLRQPDDSAHGLATELEQRYPHLYTLRQCLRHGVAYHNAALPDWVRRQLELLIERRELDIVAATTTLAEGVDMPFRVVVMADWRSWLFGRRRPMPTLLFHNIAGRCGRAWEFPEGDTIIVDNPGREPGSFRDRYQEYVSLYVNPEPFPLRSSIDWTMRSNDKEILADTRAVLESQFAAYLAIPTTSDSSDDTEAAFVQSLYAARSPASADYCEGTTHAFTTDMLAEREHPVLERRSPLRLTDFGEDVLKTGLSPRSGVALAHFLDSFEGTAEPSQGRVIRARHGIEWKPLLAGMWAEIRKGPWVREIEGYPLKGQIEGVGHPVTSSNFLTVLMAWVSGVSLEAIAYLTLRDTGLKQEAESWLNGVSDHPPSWFEDWMEDLAQFCSGYLGSSWSWVCRGGALIGHSIGHEELSNELERLAGQLSLGVSRIEAQEALRRGCPVDRARLDWIVAGYKQATGAEMLEATAFVQWLRTEADYLVSTPIGFFANVRVSERDISELDRFMQLRWADVAGEE
jgi:helicase